MVLLLPKDERKDIGNLGENLAARFLEERGYKILKRNYRQPWGEIDIIVEKDGVVIFCEVKTNSCDCLPAGRQAANPFAPEVRVDQRKVWQITKSAELFLAKNGSQGTGEWRIDIIAVTILKQEQKAKITHFKNAVGGY